MTVGIVSRSEVDGIGAHSVHSSPSTGDDRGVVVFRRQLIPAKTTYL